MQSGQASRTLVITSQAIRDGLVSSSQLRDALQTWVKAPSEPFERILADHADVSIQAVEKLDQSVAALALDTHDDPSATMPTYEFSASEKSALARLVLGDIDAALTLIHPALKRREHSTASAPQSGEEATIGRVTHEKTVDLAQTEQGPGDQTLDHDSFGGSSGGMGGASLKFGAESRYRKIRRHAAGGLGEVFVALDEELHREVALKEIKVKYADGAQSRSRFMLEAEVTGGLEHPGIVPVYGLGQYSDGRPYYAMRFIRGESLKEAVDAFHDPEFDPTRTTSDRDVAFRALLARFIDVCQAMAYAHSRGVLHRDLKPANVMVGTFGETLVVDWGLAKAQGHEDIQLTKQEHSPLIPLSSANTEETLEGSAMGTPQYMSPEQAAGRLTELGPPSDIYSLGATLYYILTCRTPFQEPNVGLILYKVQRGDFPTPRSLDRNIPGALNAICLKAMALRPQDRYETCLDLAKDIERWLADEPIAAYREPVPARAVRWSRRHRTLVTTVAALVITSTLGLGFFNVALGREKNRTERNYQIARTAVDEMLGDLGAVELADVPQMEAVRRTMLKKAFDFYQTFLIERGQDPTLARDAGRASRRLGDIHEMLGEYRLSERAYREALKLLVKVDAPEEMAAAYHGLGVLYKKSLRFDESEKALREAMTLRTKPGNNPASEQARNETIYQLGTLMARQVGKGQAADQAYRQAVEAQTKLVDELKSDPYSRRMLARYRNNVGILLKRSDPEAAKDLFADSVAIQDELAAKSPTVAGLQWERARSRANLGTTFAGLGQIQAGVDDLMKAQAIFESLASDYPAVPDYAVELASLRENLAIYLQRLQKPIDAQASLDEAITGLKNLAYRYPTRPDIRLRLARAERSRGLLLHGTDGAAAYYFAARTALEELQREAPEIVGSPEFLGSLASSIEARAMLFLFPGETAEPKLKYLRKEFVTAIGLYEQAIGIAARDAEYEQGLITTTAYLIQTDIDLKDHVSAAKEADRLPSYQPKNPSLKLKAAHWLALCADLAGPNSSDAAYDRDRCLSLLTEANSTGSLPIEELVHPDFKSIALSPEFLKLREDISSRPKPQGASPVPAHSK